MTQDEFNRDVVEILAQLAKRAASDQVVTQSKIKSLAAALPVTKPLFEATVRQFHPRNGPQMIQGSTDDD